MLLGLKHKNTGSVFEFEAGWGDGLGLLQLLLGFYEFGVEFEGV